MILLRFYSVLIGVSVVCQICKPMFVFIYSNAIFKFRSAICVISLSRLILSYQF